MNKLFTSITLLFVTSVAYCQSQFSGDLQLNGEFYDRDTLIGASGTPHYDNLLSGIDSWLTVNYQNDALGLEAGIRLDIFNNSNLHNPGTPYTGQGIGRWYISKTIDQFKITGGYIYDQFATGLIFRSYEERPLGIDNALFGLELQYNLGENWVIKAIAGKQKDLFTTFDPVLKGANIEGNILTKTGAVSFTPGIAFLNRTLDQNNMNLIIAAINAYPLEDRFIPKYNMYAASFYNTLNYKNISWYIEYATKSHEAIKDLNGDLKDTPGNVLYTNLTYSKTNAGKGFGITGQYRKVDNWVMRTSPNEVLLDGTLDYLPSLTKQNSLRLTARYQAVAQQYGEQAYQVNITYTPVKGYTFTVNYSDVSDPDQLQLFREVYADMEIHNNTKWKLELGMQYLNYNQEIFENHPGVPLVKAITPFTEFTYKIDRKKSLRFELQYQHCDQDYGSWLFGLAEFNVAPRWSISASDMWNYDPLKTDDALHFPNIFAAYTQNANRFTLGYSKQIAGIVCTGGICRYEPAFSGIKLGITSTF